MFGGAYRTVPELTSRGANLRFAQTWTDWVWQLATGGDGGDRTLDLLNAIQALSQLSYAPNCYTYVIITLSKNQEGIIFLSEKHTFILTFLIVWVIIHIYKGYFASHKF